MWNISGTPAQTPSGCQDAVYNTDQVTPLACAVSWVGGATTTLSFTVHVETSTPTATATPDRPPDANGRYNHPVTVTLAGSAFSGIASCTPVQTYAGPATTATALAGTCTDNAGKTASASLPFRYDATPPSLSVTSEPADRMAGLSWQASAGPAPLAWVQVSRRPGLKGAAGSVLYTGTAQTGYEDRQVRNGTAYSYTRHGGRPGGQHHPADGEDQARGAPPCPCVGRPPQTPADAALDGDPEGQLLQRADLPGSKILSAWPTRPSLKLARSWSFGGRRHRLAPGRYHWYVWPGYGPQRDARYGHAVGNAIFVIR